MSKNKIDKKSFFEFFQRPPIWKKYGTLFKCHCLITMFDKARVVILEVKISHHSKRPPTISHMKQTPPHVAHISCITLLQWRHCQCIFCNIPRRIWMLVNPWGFIPVWLVGPIVLMVMSSTLLVIILRSTQWGAEDIVLPSVCMYSCMYVCMSAP